MGRFSVPKGKVQLHIYISERLYRRLVELAPSAYGGQRIRGALSKLVEELLWDALERRGGLHAHTRSAEQFHATSLNNSHNGSASSFKNRLPPAERKLVEIAQLMYSRHFTHAITVGDLKQLIATVAGRDPRTIKKYAQALAEKQVLKHRQITEVNWSNQHLNTRILEVNFEALQTLLNHGS